MEKPKIAIKLTILHHIPKENEIIIIVFFAI